MEPIKFNTHPGYPKVIALAKRLGVAPHDVNIDPVPRILVYCGPNGSPPAYSIEDLLDAALDRLDEKLK